MLVVLASMWNLLAGYSGLVSIGQQAFVGLGAYTLIVFGNGFDQDIYFSVLPAGLSPSAPLAIIAVVAFRLRGAYFAVGTWVIAEVVRLLVTNNKGDVINGGSGTSLEADEPTRPLDRSQTTALIALLLAAVARRSTSCCARASGWRCRRSATTRTAPAASASTSTARASSCC